MRAARRKQRGGDLSLRVSALESAIDAGRSWLSPELLDRADQLTSRARQRLAQSAEHTVVALAGSTGSGKSSIFNVLAGQEIAVPGVLRPTTAEALAAVWDVEGTGRDADRLLDWLEVPDRTYIAPADPPATPGLLLVDLPDDDSVVIEHRIRADLLVDRADLLVWVVDPQKYADAVLHERYLRPLAGHSKVVLVVLNQIDKLAPTEQQQCLADLRRLVTEDGLGAAAVLGVSARTGQGIADLSDRIRRAVAERRAATERLLADLRAVAEDIIAECGPAAEFRSRAAARTELVDTLWYAAHADVVVEAVRGSVLLRGRAATGWPLTRWVSRLRPDPLRRLGLLRKEVRTELARNSRPVTDATLAARTRTAVRKYVDEATTGAPSAWVLQTRARVDVDGLPDALDRAVARTELDGDRHPRWWSVAAVSQWVMLAVLGVGLAWLAALAVLSAGQQPVHSTPGINGYSIPSVLVVAGLALGVLLALLARLLAANGARRVAKRAARRLRTQISLVASLVVLEPVEVQRRALDECRTGAAMAGR